MSYIDEVNAGIRGDARMPNDQSPGYLQGQDAVREAGRREPLPPRPVTEGEIAAGNFMVTALNVSFLAALAGAGVAWGTDHNVGEWAVGAGALTFAAFTALVALLAVLATSIWFLRVTLPLVLVAVLVAAPTALVLLALHAFDIGPGLTFL